MGGPTVVSYNIYALVCHSHFTGMHFAGGRAGVGSTQRADNVERVGGLGFGGQVGDFTEVAGWDDPRLGRSGVTILFLSVPFSSSNPPLLFFAFRTVRVGLMFRDSYFSYCYFIFSFVPQFTF